MLANLGNLRHWKQIRGTPGGGLQSVNQISAITQKGHTPVALADGHHAQRLAQWHLGPQKGCIFWKGSHNVVSKEVPVHPGNQGKNNDPGRRSCHKAGRARNRVSRLTRLPGWVCGIHNIAGYQAPPPSNVWNGADPPEDGKRRPVNQDTPQGAPK
eukprot:2210993-Amphidinium_carterae.2